MTSTQVRYFLTLSECGSFSMTADLHYVTQPVISKQISALERELGLKLFSRRSYPAVLTSAGRIIYEHCKSVSAGFEKTLLEAKRAQNAEFGKISVGITSSTEIADIRPALSLLKRKFPEASIEITEQVLPIWPGELREGLYDVAITEFNDQFNFHDLSFIRLAMSEEFLLFSAQHPLAGKQDLSMRDFEDEDFVFLMASRETDFPVKKFMKTCEKNHLSHLPGYFFVDSIETMDRYLRSGKAVTIRKRPSHEEEEYFRCISIGSSSPVGIAYATSNQNILVDDFVRWVIDCQRDGNTGNG